MGLLLFAAPVTFAQVPNISDFGNPLVDAADHGDRQLVNNLINTGISPNVRGKFDVTPLMRASYKGNKEVVELLLQYGAEVNIADKGGATALHLASRQGNTEIVSILIKHGAIIDVADNEGWTPLMRASANKKVDIVDLLIQAGANVNLTNNSGESPLMQAAKGGNLKIVKMLLEKGADVTHESSSGNSTVSIIQKSRDKNLQELVFSAKGSDAVKDKEPKAADEKQEGGKERIKKLENLWNEFPEKKEEIAVAKEEEKEDFLEEKPKNKIKNDVAKQEIKKSQKADKGIKESEREPEDKSVSNELEEVKNPEENKEVPKEEPKPKELPEVKEKPSLALVNPPAIHPEDNYYLLQFGTFQTQDEAKQRLDWSVTKHGDILAEYKGFVNNVDNESGGIDYRARMGLITSRKEAISLCTELRMRSVECYVVETTIIPPEFSGALAAIEKKENVSDISKQEILPKPEEKKEELPAVVESKPAEQAKSESKIDNQPEEDKELQKEEQKQLANSDLPKSGLSVAENEIKKEKSEPTSLKDYDKKSKEVKASIQNKNLSKGRKDIDKRVADKKDPFANLPKIPASMAYKLKDKNNLEELPWLNPSGSLKMERKEDLRKTAISIETVQIEEKIKIIPDNDFRNDELPWLAKEVADIEKKIAGDDKKESDTKTISDEELEGQKAKVEVAEAIRVPVSNHEPYKSKPSSLKMPAYDFLPSADAEKPGYWIQISSFKSEDEAIEHFEKISSEAKLNLRLRVVTSSPDPSITNISLRAGEFNSVSEATKVCEYFRKGDLECVLVADVGYSTPANVERSRSFGYQRNEDSAGIPYEPTNPYLKERKLVWVQFGSFANEFFAFERWKQLQTVHKDILGKLNVNISRPAQSSSGVSNFRLRAGPFTERDAADKLCNNLKRRYLSCVVAED